jgi:predicted kinase
VSLPALVLVTGPQGTGKSAVAEAAAGHLGTAVVGHDWVMSALRPYPEVQRALEAMEPQGNRVVGWSVMNALAREQLRHGRSIVLDGVARAPEVTRCRETARAEDARTVLIATTCSDPGVHRSRIEGRQRHIPDWYELDWEHVAEALVRWEPPADADLTLDAADPWDGNVSRLVRLLGPSGEATDTGA